MSHINTLRGIFPEPRQSPKKNFVKENVKQIKVMQGLVKNSSDMDVKIRSANSKMNRKKVPMSAQTSAKFLLGSADNTNRLRKLRNTKSSITSNNNKSNMHSPNQKSPKPKHRHVKTQEHQIQTSPKGWTRLDATSFYIPDLDLPEDPRITHRSMQTEDTCDPHKLYQSGVIKYPSPDALKNVKKKVPPLRASAFGAGDIGPKSNKSSPKKSPTFMSSSNNNNNNSDDVNVICTEMGSVKLDYQKHQHHDYVKENALAVKACSANSKNNALKDPTKAPPDYKKGVIPKYLQERKEELVARVTSDDPDCPKGHILLPDEERKQTLQVLRQSYADRVQELNSMPVRTDTLRQRRRKMELEMELDKIDAGIKVFQRPKVYVKIDA